MDKSSLIYPMFIVEGTNIKEEIPSMMGQYRYSVDRMEEKLEQLSKAGIGGVMLFGIPDHKDEVGSGDVCTGWHCAAGLSLKQKN